MGTTCHNLTYISTGVDLSMSLRTLGRDWVGQVFDGFVSAQYREGNAHDKQNRSQDLPSLPLLVPTDLEVERGRQSERDQHADAGAHDGPDFGDRGDGARDDESAQDQEQNFSQSD